LKKIGLATTSQTPRDDVVPSLRKMISRSVEFVQAGALDDLTKQEILRLTPKNDADVLVSRARDGSEIMFGKSHIIPRLQKCIDDLNAKKVEAIALLCAGSFPRFESKAPIVRPDLLMYGFLKAIPNMEKVGLLLPNEKQQGPIGKEFEDEGFQVATSWLSPYREGSVEEAVKPFRGEEVTMISLLCMGHSLELKEKITKLTSKPAVLSQSLLAKAIEELL
jgi:protein AroM